MASLGQPRGHIFQQVSLHLRNIQSMFAWHVQSRAIHVWQVTSGTSSAVLNRLDAGDFSRTRLLVAGSGGSVSSGTGFDFIEVSPLLLADAVVAT